MEDAELEAYIRKAVAAEVGGTCGRRPSNRALVGTLARPESPIASRSTLSLGNKNVRYLIDKSGPFGAQTPCRLYDSVRLILHGLHRRLV